MPQENGCREDSTQGAFAVGEARVRQESTSEAGSPREEEGGGMASGSSPGCVPLGKSSGACGLT